MIYLEKGKKYVIIFGLGIAVGFLAPKAIAQDRTDSVSTYLRTSSNTADNRLSVRVSSGNKNPKLVKIFNIIGNEVASIELTGKTGPFNFTLDGTQLENGIYLCNLYSDKGIIETKKFYWSR